MSRFTNSSVSALLEPAQEASFPISSGISPRTASEHSNLSAITAAKKAFTDSFSGLGQAPGRAPPFDAIGAFLTGAKASTGPTPSPIHQCSATCEHGLAPPPTPGDTKWLSDSPVGVKALAKSATAIDPCCDPTDPRFGQHKSDTHALLSPFQKLQNESSDGPMGVRNIGKDAFALDPCCDPSSPNFNQHRNSTHPPIEGLATQPQLEGSDPQSAFLKGMKAEASLPQQQAHDCSPSCNEHSVKTLPTPLSDPSPEGPTGVTSIAKNAIALDPCCIPGSTKSHHTEAAKVPAKVVPDDALVTLEPRTRDLQTLQTFDSKELIASGIVTNAIEAKFDPDRELAPRTIANDALLAEARPAADSVYAQAPHHEAPAGELSVQAPASLTTEQPGTVPLGQVAAEAQRNTSASTPQSASPAISMTWTQLNEGVSSSHTPHHLVTAATVVENGSTRAASVTEPLSTERNPLHRSRTSLEPRLHEAHGNRNESQHARRAVAPEVGHRQQVSLNTRKDPQGPSSIPLATKPAQSTRAGLVESLKQLMTRPPERMPHQHRPEYTSRIAAVMAVMSKAQAAAERPNAFIRVATPRASLERGLSSRQVLIEHLATRCSRRELRLTLAHLRAHQSASQGSASQGNVPKGSNPKIHASLIQAALARKSQAMRATMAKLSQLTEHNTRAQQSALRTLGSLRGQTLTSALRALHQSARGDPRLHNRGLTRQQTARLAPRDQVILRLARAAQRLHGSQTISQRLALRLLDQEARRLVARLNRMNPKVTSSGRVMSSKATAIASQIALIEAELARYASFEIESSIDSELPHLSEDATRLTGPRPSPLKARRRANRDPRRSGLSAHRTRGIMRSDLTPSVASAPTGPSSSKAAKGAAPAGKPQSQAMPKNIDQRGPSTSLDVLLVKLNDDPPAEPTI